MRLIKPNINLKIEYLEMLWDWKSTEEKMVPFSLGYDTSDFKKFIETNKKHEINPESGFVSHSTYWLINDSNKIIGTSNIRHKLNDSLLIENEHIGYGIRPTFRGKGYATKILGLSLKKS